MTNIQLQERLSFLKRPELYVIMICIAAYISIHAMSLQHVQAYGWDESVYIHTSNYLASGGERGILESLRPILFPVMLLPVTVLPFDYQLLFGRILILGMSALALWAFYLTIKKIDNKNAWVYTLIMGFFPYYIINSLSALTEIPAILAHILAVYFLINKKFKLSGIFSVAAFMIRFPFGIYIGIISLFLLIFYKKGILDFIKGTIIAAPLLLIHTFAYMRYAQADILQATIYPIWNQLMDNTASVYLWFYDKGIMFYFRYLMDWSIILILGIVGLVFLINQGVLESIRLHKSEKKANGKSEQIPLNILLSLLLCMPVIYLVVSAHKEPRYLLLAVPWIAYACGLGMIISANGITLLIKKIFSLSNALKSRKIIEKTIIFILVGTILIGGIIQSSDNLRYAYPEKEFYEDYLKALQNIPSDKTVLVSMPMVQTDGKMVIGYYDYNYMYDQLKSKDYDYVYFTDDERMYPCKSGDGDCISVKMSTKKLLEDKYKIYLDYSSSTMKDSRFIIYSIS